ncbi:MAG: prepilin-type N-terminal cleavage/methylation domain-containing protein [Candidatus Sumerlaeia bacterium]|nr:prepilin-type N-terminal cleavage/methylation domain-containing protein [Candidatus Sumerlaeia bacterium]
MQPTSRAAFTLIELLIVVAIIAILAAIAVPNFLEAQTRAKVARAKADMRSLDLALEAYHIDNNGYPYIVDSNGLEWQMPAGFPPGAGSSGPGGLTTPIAYITSSLPDPFVLNQAENPAMGPQGKPSLYYERLGFGYDGAGMRWDDNGSGFRAVRVCVDGNGTLSGTAPDFNTTDISLIPARWVLFSIGPDRSHRVYNPDGSILVRSRFSVLNRYDPTNGTVSQGNVLRLPGGISYP